MGLSSRNCLSPTGDLREREPGGSSQMTLFDRNGGEAIDEQL